MSDIWFWIIDYALTIFGLVMMWVIYRRQDSQERRIEQKEDRILGEGKIL